MPNDKTLCIPNTYIDAISKCNQQFDIKKNVFLNDTIHY